MADPVIAVGTPAQQGVAYESGECPSFGTGTLVPNGDSASIKEVGEVTKTMDGTAEVVNIGTSGHHVVVSGEFSLKALSAVPNVGDMIASDETAPRNFVITSDVEVTAFSTGGKPLIVKFDAEHHPLVVNPV